MVKFVNGEPCLTYLRVHWDLDEDANGNVWHIAENGLTKEDVDEVLKNPEFSSVSNSSGRPLAFGRTRKGEYTAVVYERIDEDSVYPITAFCVED